MKTAASNGAAIGRRLAQGKLGLDPSFTPKNGGSAFFVSKGTPYIGSGPGPRVGLTVRAGMLRGVLIFNDVFILEHQAAELARMFRNKGARPPQGFNAALRTFIATTGRHHGAFPFTAPQVGLSNRQFRRLLNQGIRAAEAATWTHIGETVTRSRSGVGRVVLGESSHVSRSGPGEFLVVRDTARVRITGGDAAIHEAMLKHGTPHPDAAKAIKALRRNRAVGRVKTVFRVGGRLLFVVAVAADTIEIIYARDRLRQVIKTAVGWGAGAAAAGTFASVFAPADTAGPVAWIAHGLGTVISFGIGYFVGSETVAHVYDVVVEEF